MLLNRTIPFMAVGLLILLIGASASGQGLQGMQLFAPAEVSSYGRGTQPNEGFFFVFDGLYWTITPPRVTTVGKEGLDRIAYRGPNLNTDEIDQHNTLDTGQFGAEFTVGNRIEFGRVSNNHGWMVSVFEMRDQGQVITVNDVDVVFDDVAFGLGGQHLLDGNVNPNAPPNVILPLPVTFTTLTMHNVVSTWGIEADYIGRSDELHNGGFFEWFIGPRYLEFKDKFWFDANGGILDASEVVNDADNHIIAGQLGARFFKKQGRWMLSTEGRGFAGLNYQNIHQSGFLGSNLAPIGTTGFPQVMGPTDINHTEFISQFSPGAEMRVEARYQITRSVTFRAGWTGLWLGNIARASNMINYTLDPEHTYLGILRDHNTQNVFMNGLVIGIDVNR
jgi:hypothetical protein